MDESLKELADDFRDQAVRLQKAADELDPPANPKPRRRRRGRKPGPKPKAGRSQAFPEAADATGDDGDKLTENTPSMSES